MEGLGMIVVKKQGGIRRRLVNKGPRGKLEKGLNCHMDRIKLQFSSPIWIGILGTILQFHNDHIVNSKGLTHNLPMDYIAK